VWQISSIKVLTIEGTEMSKHTKTAFITIQDLTGDLRDRALGRIIQCMRNAASSRKSISLAAVALCDATDNELLDIYAECGCPGLPNGYGGDSVKFSNWCAEITSGAAHE
jgi:NifB/MoaA-like Fe-S oxidoreductase